MVNDATATLDADGSVLTVSFGGPTISLAGPTSDTVVSPTRAPAVASGSRLGLGALVYLSAGLVGLVATLGGLSNHKAIVLIVFLSCVINLALTNVLDDSQCTPATVLIRVPRHISVTQVILDESCEMAAAPTLCNGLACECSTTAEEDCLHVPVVAESTCPAREETSVRRRQRSTRQAPEVVGATLGQLKVSEGGDASFFMPLRLPPGSGGVEPALGLAYSSSDTNGVGSGLGVGWSIGGLSRVHRCPNHKTNAYNRAVALDSSDAICLDGVPLVQWAVDGANVEYRTDPFTFDRIVGHGAASGGLESATKFVVERQGGIVHEFAVQKRISRHDQSLVTTAFLLSTVRDRFDNFYTVEYNVNELMGHDMVTKIAYTGNTKAGVVPYNEVRFACEPMAQPLVSFMSGARIVTPCRVSRIDVVSELQVVYSYALKYELAGDVAYLVSVQECALGNQGSTADCFQPLVFDWALPAKQPAIESQSVITSVSSSSNEFGKGYRGTWHQLVGDFDGDGVSDFINPVLRSGANTGPHLYRGLGDGTFSDPALAFWEPSLQKVCGVTRQCSQYADFYVGDFDGDGKADLLDYQPSSSQMVVWSWNATVSALQPMREQPYRRSGGDRNFYLGDFNGDGKTDLLYKGTTLWQSKGDGLFEQYDVKFSTPPPISVAHQATHSNNVVVGDFNGDSLTDFAFPVGNSNQYTFLAEFDATTGRVGFRWVRATRPSGNCDTRSNPCFTGGGDWLVGDFNGDGLDDKLSTTNNPWAVVWYSRGDGTFLRGVFENAEVLKGNNGWSAAAEKRRLILMDINGDGRTDVMQLRDEKRINYWLGQPLRLPLNDSATDFYNQAHNAFVLQTQTVPTDSLLAGSSDSTDLRNRFYAGLFTQDNSPALLRLFSNKQADIWRPTQSVLENVITGFTDSLGAVTEVEYARLSSAERGGSAPDLYTKGTNANTAAGESDVPSGLTVVAAVHRDDGLGGQRTVQYRYSELVRHALPKHGLLGFRTVRTIDTGLNSIHSATRSLDWRNGFVGVNIASRTSVNGVETDRTLVTLSRKLVTHPTDTSITLSWTATARDEHWFYDPDTPGTELGKRTTTHTVDAYGNVVRSTDAHSDWSGTWTTTTTREVDNDVQRWLLGKVRAQTITHSWFNATATKRQTKTSSFAVNEQTGLPVSEVVDPATLQEHRIAYTYDDWGNVASTRKSAPDLEQQVSTSKFDKFGRFPVSQTNAAGHETVSEYDGRTGNVVRTTDPNGVVVTRKLDLFGRTLEETTSRGAKTTIERVWCSDVGVTCPSGAVYLVEKAEAGGGVGKQMFDKLGRSVRAESLQTNGRWSATTVRYDALGRVVERSEPFHVGSKRVQHTKTQFDNLGRVQQIIGADGNITSIAYEGLKTITTNAKKQKLSEHRNLLGLLLESVDHEELVTAIAYSPSGDRELVRLPALGANHDLTIKYDNAGRVLWRHDANVGKRTTYSYDAFGRQVSVSNGAHTATQKYDTLDRLIERTSSDGDTYTWTYDGPNGRGFVASASGPKFEEAITYDEQARPKAHQYTIQGEKLNVERKYDAFGRVESTRLPSGFEQTVRRSACTGAVTRVYSGDGGLLWRATGYSARGSLTSETFGNGVERETSFDVLGRVSHIDARLGIAKSPLQDMRFQWDAVGNLVKRDARAAKFVDEFRYDTLNRVTASYRTDLRPGSKQVDPVTLLYEANGNIESKSGIGRYSYDATFPHRVTRAGGQHSLSYDEWGNVKTLTLGGGDDTTSFEYAFDNMVTSISGERKGVKVKTELGYDQGRGLVWRRDSRDSQTTQTIRLAVDGVIYEHVTQPNGDVLHRHTLAKDVVITVRGLDGFATTRYLLRDHLGSVVGEVDSSGRIVRRVAYDVFGVASVSLGDGLSPSTSRGYTGAEYSELGVVLMGARVYDPMLGRFLQSDPAVPPDASDAQSLNQYSYVGNNPLSRVDPSGRFFKKAFKKLFRGVGKAVKSVVHAVGQAFKKSAVLHAVVRTALTAIALPAGPMAVAAVNGAYSAFVTRINGGSMGDVLRAFAIDAVTSYAFGSLGGISDPVRRAAIGAGAGALGALASGQSISSGIASGLMAAGMGGKSGAAGPSSTPGGFIRLLAGAAGHAVAREVISETAHKLGVNVDLINAALFAVSWMGQSRYHPLENDPTKLENSGIFTRGLKGLPSDVADVLLAYQGLPTRTEVDLMVTGLYKNVVQGHSLGAMATNNMIQWGLLEPSTVHLTALPFGNYATTGVSVENNPTDIVPGLAAGCLSGSCGWFFKIPISALKLDFVGAHGYSPSRVPVAAE